MTILSSKNILADALKSLYVRYAPKLAIFCFLNKASHLKWLEENLE